jgi:hypothetical protein
MSLIAHPSYSSRRKKEVYIYIDISPNTNIHIPYSIEVSTPKTPRSLGTYRPHKHARLTSNNNSSSNKDKEYQKSGVSSHLPFPHASSSSPSYIKPSLLHTGPRRRPYHPFFLAKRLFSNTNTLLTLNWTYSRSRSSWLSFCISSKSSSLRSSSRRPRLRPL